MKPALLLIFICSIALGQTPSQYHVVRVVGHVESPALKRELKTGDVIQSKDQLRFGTKESYIIVNSPQTGRKRISGIPDNSPREFLQLLQSFVQPDTKSTSTRAISMVYLEELQNSMSHDTLLVLGDGFVPVNIKKLSLAKPAIIRAWHYDQNKKRVYKELSDANGFRLSQQQLYGNVSESSEKFIRARVAVLYFEDGAEDPAFTPGVLLGAFVPMYHPREAELASELRSLISARDKGVTVLAEIHSYLREEYAPAQEDNLKAWLKLQGISF